MIEIRECLKGVELSANSIRDVQLQLGNENLSILISDILPLSPSISAYSWVLSNLMSLDFSHLQGFSFSRLYGSELQYEVKLGDKKVAYELGLEKRKGFQRRHVQSARRIKILTKHNYQPRQAIMFRHHKEEMKGDG